MSLDKAIKYKKEKRKEYYGTKAVDPTCRCHGGCEYCRNNRMHKNRKRTEASKDKLEELDNEVDEE